MSTEPKLSDDCFSLPPGVYWTPVDVALARLKQGMQVVCGSEFCQTANAGGRILAKPAIAVRANPPFANAAVDGYGFAFASLGTAPHSMSLLDGRAAGGAPFLAPVPAGQALRILTGAALPLGVDTIVLQEEVQVSTDFISFGAGLKQGANTRRIGEDVAKGATVFAATHVLLSQDLALLSALGVLTVSVRKRLRVGVLSTGDELCAPDAIADPAQIYDANRPMLLDVISRWGMVGVDLGQAGDSAGSVEKALDRGAKLADAILTTGGASAGDEDHISAALSRAGTIQSWRIAMKPGRPLALGLWKGVPVFGLPGNPVAAFVCALIFARPALMVLAGRDWSEPTGYSLPAAFTKMKKPGRHEYLRARLTQAGHVDVFQSEGSGRISGLSWANGLVELGDPAAEITPGTPVRFLPFSDFGL